MKTDPNAPAYPTDLIDPECSGLTKREAMAMHICAGICHDYGNVVMAKGEGINHVANLSVKIADALILALNKEMTDG